MWIMNYEEIKSAAMVAVSELIDIAELRAGDIFVVGCSSSEIVGSVI